MDNDVSKEKALNLINKIDDGYDADRREKARQYIGASIVGNPCDALLAYNLRGFPNDEPNPRLKRIFNLGHILEDEIVKDLKKKAGVQVWEVDGLTGRQHTYEELGGHVVCHTDGLIELEQDDPMILEIKSMNDASFKKFQKSGVKISHPQYYAQCTMMMGMSGLQQTLFIAMNKNNCDYHAQIVDYDEFEWAYLKERIERAINNRAGKISADETDWRCKGKGSTCFKFDVCWGDKKPNMFCSSCKHAEANESDIWYCTYHDRTAREVCSDYEVYHPRPKA